MSIGIAMCGAIMFGIDCANFGSVIGFEKFIEKWCVGNFGTYEECDPLGDRPDGVNRPAGWDNGFVMWGNTLLVVGAAVAAIGLAPTLTEKFGRRMDISIGAFIVFLGCIISDVSPTVAVFYLSRFVTGFGIGTCTYALPIYNSEVATPMIRGKTGALFQWNTVAGSWFVALLVNFMHNWYVGMMLPGIAGLIVSMVIWTVPESPRWLLKYKGRDAALASLTLLRKAGSDVGPELDSIQEAMDSEATMPKVGTMDLMKPGLRNRVFLAIGLQVCQQLTGVNAILGQSQTFFGKFGIPKPYLFNNVWTGLQLISVTIGALIIDSRFGGRRSQLLLATCCMGPPLFLSAIFLQVDAPWILGALMLCIYGCAFQYAWGLVPWVYPSEIFTMSERTAAMGIAVFFQYGMNALVYFTSPVMIHWSIIGTCIIFGVINVFNLAVVTRYVKETKGVPLEMVPQLFE